jgi:transcriptional regulator with XRE-family HTH domain
VGIYIERLRNERGWSIRELASIANVSYRALSKLELDRSLPRHPEVFLWKIAEVFNVHPDNLFIRASLTPLLRPPKDEIATEPMKTVTFPLKVTEEESIKLEKYLYYLRFLDSVDSVRRLAEKEIGSTET